MIKIIPKTHNNVYVLIGHEIECPELAKQALKHRLYVSGWDLNPTLHQLKKHYRNCTIALLFLNNIPIAVSLQESNGNIQVFVRKCHRRNGYGSIVIHAVINNKLLGFYRTDYGIQGSYNFFDKIRKPNNISQQYKDNKSCQNIV